MKEKNGLASLILAMVVLLTSPSFAKGKNNDLSAVYAAVEGASDQVEQARDDLQTADAVGSALGTLFGRGKKRPRNLETWDNKNPETDVLVLMPFRDIRERTGQVIRNYDRRGRLVSEFYYINTDNVAEKAHSDIHVNFVNFSRWIVKDMMMARGASELVNGWLNKQIDKRTLIQLGREWAAQQALFGDIKDFSLRRKIIVEGKDGSISNTEMRFEMNCFIVDLLSGTTKIGQTIRMSRKNLNVDWQLLGGNAAAGYIEQLKLDAITEAALQAAQVMSLAKEDPSRIIDANIIDRIRGDVINQKPGEVLYKGLGEGGLMGDLVEVEERAWTLRFKDVKGIKPGETFNIWSVTQLGVPNVNTRVKVEVDFVFPDKNLVGTHVINQSELGRATSRPAADEGSQETESGESQQGVRPSAEKPVEPQATVAEKFSRALPGDVLPFEGEAPDGNFSAFVALKSDFIPNKGEKEATWLQRGKVVLVVPPANSKDQPIKALVGHSGYKGNPDEWVVWVIGDPPTANAAGEKVAWDGWRIYPYDPARNQKGR